MLFYCIWMRHLSLHFVQKNNKDSGWQKPLAADSQGQGHRILAWNHADLTTSDQLKFCFFILVFLWYNESADTNPAYLSKITYGSVSAILQLAELMVRY